MSKPKLVSVRLEDETLDREEYGMKKDIAVREISNGYILRETIRGKEDKDSDWVHKSTETYYKDNPMEDEDSGVSLKKLADHF